MKPDAQIEKEAALWLIRRDRGEPSPGESFEAWLAADSRHRTAYLSLENLWRGSDQLKVYQPRDGVLDTRILEATLRGTRTTRRAIPVLIAAALATVAVLSVLAWTVFMRPTVVYATDVGGFERALLDDGSVILINTNSRIEVKLAPRVRAVTLLRGEAHFVVAHDTQRPFEVTAGNTIVRAVGTAFSVRIRDPHNVDVLVTEGRVMLRRANESAEIARLPVAGTRGAPAPDKGTLLGAAELAQIETGNPAIHTLPAAEVGRLQAWQSGNLVFEGTRLQQVVAEFNRYNRRQLVLADPRLAGIELGGEFRSTDIDGFLRALKASFGIRAQEANGVIRLQ